MTTSTKSLEQKIENAVEQLVREHLLSCEAAAATAVRAGFRRAASLSPASHPPAKSPRRVISRRRAADEIAELEERLYAAIVAQPGETMTVLAPAVGASARELNRPALVLRRKGRVRSVGKRQSTRYFPMGQ